MTQSTSANSLQSRRGVLLGLATIVFLPITRTANAEQSSYPSVRVYRGSGCDCCGKWGDHMKAAGFDVEMINEANLQSRKAKLGVPSHLGSCHTAVIGNHFFEGHVPPQDIVRFLAEKRDFTGLAVPGMPIGSPGMEDGDNKEPFDVLAVRADGTSEVFASY